VLSRVFTGYEPERYSKGAIPQAIHHPEWKVGRIGFQPYPYPSATRFIVRQLTNTLVEGNTGFLKRLDADFAAKDLVDYIFVKKAIANAGGLEKFDSVNIENPWDREEIIGLD
jgi:NitT/TauT family transport system substrate-binding protein